MTDGIIQKVFEKIYNQLKDQDDSVTVQKGQQELIAEIKQEINENHINGFDTGNLTRWNKKDIVLSKIEVLSKLIGDNQE